MFGSIQNYYEEDKRRNQDAQRCEVFKASMPGN